MDRFDEVISYSLIDYLAIEFSVSLKCQVTSQLKCNLGVAHILAPA